MLHRAKLLVDPVQPGNGSGLDVIRLVFPLRKHLLTKGQGEVT
ncbi:hypothetical protein [Sodalis sp.]